MPRRRKSASCSRRRVIDLQMLLLFGGGRIRTEAELRRLFAEAGLEVTRVLPAPPSPNLVIEGRSLTPPA